MAGSEETLNVIALVSGGKDSFFSILHCLANGHRVVALANLYPPPPPDPASDHGSAVATKCDSATTIRDSSQDPRHQHVWHPSPSGVRADDDGGGGSGGGGGGASGIGPYHDHHQRESESEEGPREGPEDQDEADLNSFMYQTVGHQVIPLYARATGLPLFRHPIVGTAVHHGLSYDHQHHHERQRHQLQNRKDEREVGGAAEEGKEEEEEADETESLVPLLRAVLVAHPEANALCTGAILSTYQRTRVESVALRLGLVPLSYLWQFPELPLGTSGDPNAGSNDYLTEDAASSSSNNTTSNSGSTGQQHQHQYQQPQQRLSSQQCCGPRHGDPDDDAQLLRDMAAVGLDARIVKVASAGLDEGFLWDNVASEAGLARVRRAMRRFGSAGGGGNRGSVLGEGGEFETLVVDGPPSLFRGGRIVIRESDRRIVREGGGSAWLSIRRAEVEPRGDGRGGAAEQPVRVPGLLDPMFRDVLQQLGGVEIDNEPEYDVVDVTTYQPQAGDQLPPPPVAQQQQQWCFIGRDDDLSGSRAPDETRNGVTAQTARVVSAIRERLEGLGQTASAIINAVVVLRSMADFPAVNSLYGSLFEEPNPPARVTVSCGNEALPEACCIAIYLTVQESCSGSNRRRGLHVQSRSYWAPANIGPYSQAISAPIFAPPSSLDGDGVDGDPAHAVYIAGQIPLVPASMTLPKPANAGLALQVTLALQHLWRVAAATDVQWWTSAVAYFPRATGTGASQMRTAALLAAAAWRAAHLWSLAPGEGGDGDDEQEGGPDLWDRRFNSAFRTFGGGGDGDEDASARTIPDWRVVRGFNDDNDDDADDRSSGEGKEDVYGTRKRQALPFMFAAEVEELPRGAAVEWHPHLGLAAGITPGSVQPCRSISSLRGGDGSIVADGSVELHHAVVRTVSGVFVQSVAAVRLAPGQAAAATVAVPANHDGGDDGLHIPALEAVVSDARRCVMGALAALDVVAPDAGGVSDPVLQLVYTDSAAFPAPASTGPRLPLPVIPCRSLWCPRGRRLALVAVFQSRLALPSSE